MNAEFIHLNLHTEYSIVDGIVRINQLVQTCKQQNMPAVALTDQSNLFSLVKFYKASVAAGIKPIIGVDIWLENEEDKKQPFKMVLLAKNLVGYHNLLKSISKSFISGQYLGIAVIKKEWLQQFSEGLIALSGGKDGDIGRALLTNDVKQAKQLLKFWQNIFPDSYYLELHRTGRLLEEEYLYRACDLAEQFQCPVVATNAVRFLQKQDFEAHEARVCINSGFVLSDPNRSHNYSEYQYLRSADEMVELFNDIPESLINSVEIAKRCSVELTFGKTFLPIFPISKAVRKDKDVTPESYFTEQSYLGLNKRLQANFDKKSEAFEEIKRNYLNRLEYEIKIICQMGFASYFLIVADFINWAKQNGIPVGPGRGSGAGSIVAYVLGITDLDPIEHELLFERFLNPERVSMPDFDIDFCMEGRDRVIEYVAKRYGRDKVAQIITYGTMAARAVVRDVGRVLGYPYGFVDKLAKLIPFELGISLERALHEEELLRRRYKQEDEVHTLIDLAMKLEGITRNAGKHAGGVVIAPSVLTDFMPLYCEAESEGVVTQFDKDDVEKIGLVKFDFLGLRTLTIINLALKNIEARHKKQIDVSLIPLDDAATYKLLQSGKTTAVFQLESRIAKDIIKRFSPDCFTDIVALVAIIRPGVLQSGMLDELVARKNGRARITYLHPKLEQVLRPTYGVVIYQEQVMQMAQVLAGYSLGSADLLRRAMGKKKPEEMALQRAVFIEGSTKNDIDKPLANTIFDLMEKFAGYGFNKSHSAAYALIAYQTAWLKTHYPAEFMAAVLSSDMDNTDKVVIFLNECKNLQLDVISPDINTSGYQFTVTNEGEILYGLGAVKGVGQAAAESIFKSRKEQGAFKDLFDLCQRVDTRRVNKRVIEALIYTGAFDKVGPNRASQIATLDIAMRVANQYEKNTISGQMDLFSDLLVEEQEVVHDYVMVSEWTKEEQLQHEKAVLGYYLCGHPIEGFISELNGFVSSTISELASEVNRTTLIAGFVKNIKIVNTKSGNRLMIMTIEDMTGSVDVTMFAESFEKDREHLVEEQLVIVEGDVSTDNFSDGYRIRATKVMSLEQARTLYCRGILLKLTANQLSEKTMQDLYNVLQNYKGGTCPVFIAYNNGTALAKLTLGDMWRVHIKEGLLRALKNNFGATNVSLIY